MKKLTPSEKRAEIRRGKYTRYVKSGAWRYSERYDAFYSARTRKWVESKCGGEGCAFCTKRPRLAPQS